MGEGAIVGGWNAFSRAADVVTVVAAIGSAIVLVIGGPVQQIIMASSLALIAIGATAVAWWQAAALQHAAETVVQGQMLRNALNPFADAMDDLKRANHELSRPELSGVDTEAARAQGFVNRCESACTAASSAMRALTGYECRVALQELYSVDQSNGGQRTAVRTIASSDRSAINGDSVDWVDENTDFEVLVAGQDCFHSHDLRISVQEGYKNSHWTPEKMKAWKATGQYPYLSTVVWPIRVKEIGSHAWRLAGFLSVDSKETDVFDLAVVKPLGSSLASVAYTGLSLYGGMLDLIEQRSGSEGE